MRVSDGGAPVAVKRGKNFLYMQESELGFTVDIDFLIYRSVYVTYKLN
jgi:hypothetical protein